MDDLGWLMTDHPWAVSGQVEGAAAGNEAAGAAPGNPNMAYGQPCQPGDDGDDGEWGADA